MIYYAIICIAIVQRSFRKIMNSTIWFALLITILVSYKSYFKIYYHQSFHWYLQQIRWIYDIKKARRFAEHKNIRQRINRCRYAIYTTVDIDVFSSSFNSSLSRKTESLSFLLSSNKNHTPSSERTPRFSSCESSPASSAEKSSFQSSLV